ncbi:MAG: methionyl-tRNA formyltransferase [Cyanobacteria bacterium HKST-UBA04]|nr:methionyl-tRNA formyltransferase [Cyanobacteria bacterium HKST-UBA04]
MTVLRVVFMGTPEFAVPSLQALLADDAIEVLAVFSQPDRPSGRGQKLTPPPVKALALAHHLPVYQPVKLRKEPDMLEALAGFAPDFLVTAAFGQILSQPVLDIPKYGTVNVHASLLPKYRGANPVQWSILNGDAETGVTTMLTELDVDTGPMLRRITVPIDPMDSAVELVEKLSQAGASILAGSLKDMASGALQPEAQDHAAATHARKLEKTDAPIDWTQAAPVLHNKIRGQQPWPGTCSSFAGQLIKFHQSLPPGHLAYDQVQGQAPRPGQIIGLVETGVAVQTGQGPLIVTQLQPPGKPRMAARDWANGALRDGAEPVFVSSVEPVLP